MFIFEWLVLIALVIRGSSCLHRFSLQWSIYTFSFFHCYCFAHGKLVLYFGSCWVGQWAVKIKHLKKTLFSPVLLSSPHYAVFTLISHFHFWLTLEKKNSGKPPPPSLQFTLFNSHFSQRSRPALALDIDLAPLPSLTLAPLQLCLTCFWEALIAVLFFFISRFTLASCLHPPPSQRPHSHTFLTLKHNAIIHTQNSQGPPTEEARSVPESIEGLVSVCVLGVGEGAWLWNSGR